MKNALHLLDDALDSLKDFQRETVDAVIDIYKQGGHQRVLVADEVGLGKTIVAKGVIAELLKIEMMGQPHALLDSPLRVTYICSNLTLAQENRKKLALFTTDAQKKYVQEPSYNRLIEVALKKKVPSDNDKILEICTLTPSTSFNLTRGHGNWYERMIIYFALIGHERLSRFENQLSKFFRANVYTEFWNQEKELFSKERLDSAIMREFYCLLEMRVDDKIKEQCGIELEDGNWLDFLEAFGEGQVKVHRETRVRACIRTLLANSCAKHLTADLFILDEFQRFKQLLDTQKNNDESLVAREVFSDEQKAKVLLLSATPFKALSQVEEDEKGNAHKEELNYLLKFISRSNHSMLSVYEAKRQQLQQDLLSLQDNIVNIDALSNKNKIDLEDILKNYICRTERVQISENYEGLFQPSKETCVNSFSIDDIKAFKAIDQLAEGLHKKHKGRQPVQLMEFYKSAPWPLSFLNGYQFKRQLDEYRSDDRIHTHIQQSQKAWLPRAGIQGYKIRLDFAPHAKTRELVKTIFQTHSEELLWVPPLMPHYPLEGAFVGQGNFSKTLLFSSWAMVPRALSGLISYEAERKLLLRRRGKKKEYYKRKNFIPPIRFDAKSGLAAEWSLVYPSKLMISIPVNRGNKCLEEIIFERTEFFKESLKSLTGYEKPSRTRQHWYTLAPILLDLMEGHEDHIYRWIKNGFQTVNDKGRLRQLEKIESIINDELPALGKMPPDLPQFLAYLSIAGPAVCIARTWKGLAEDCSDAMIFEAASNASFAVLSMFNKRQSKHILEKRYDKTKYFQSIVRYCADGDFQAMIDEYGHLLKSAGFSIPGKSSRHQNSATARLMEVLTLQTVPVGCQFEEDKYKDGKEIVEKADKGKNRHTLRCHYAVPLGNQKITDEKGIQRMGNVRNAFNSPFKPFVLNSTSIGQEGLDFHWYCHRVVHWNLPSNPIDIEQREGRVNRYKSLVVRKRIAQTIGKTLGQKDLSHSDNPKDVWEFLFDSADTETRANRKSDLIPFWHFPNGDARIERFVPLFPMSKDATKYDNALEILSLYRLAFGQPRQEELLKNLLKRRFSETELKKITDALVINLSPLLNNRS